MLYYRGADKNCQEFKPHKTTVTRWRATAAATASATVAGAATTFYFADLVLLVLHPKAPLYDMIYLVVQLLSYSDVTLMPPSNRGH